MRLSWRSGAAAVFGLIFLGLFAWSYAGQPGSTESKSAPADEIVLKRGNSGKYLYAISDIQGHDKKIVQFDPSIPPNDAVVLGALRGVARDGYNLTVGEDVQPVVETISETNYVTFTVGQKKILFELFRNSSEQVGSARFWLEETK